MNDNNPLLPRHSVPKLETSLRSIQPVHINHYQWETNGYAPRVDVRIAYATDGLHLMYHVDESDPLVRFTQMNEDVYKDSCVEFFVQPDPEHDTNYFNFEFNAAGTLLLGYGTGRDRVRIRDVDPSLFQIRTQTGLTGSFSPNPYWELQCFIPFHFMKERFPNFKASSGSVLKGNFYKCGDETAKPHFGSWSPVRCESPDFHRSDFFGELVFE